MRLPGELAPEPGLFVANGLVLEDIACGEDGGRANSGKISVSRKRSNSQRNKPLISNNRLILGNKWLFLRVISRYNACW